MKNLSPTPSPVLRYKPSPVALSMIFEAKADAPPVKAPTPRAGKIVLVNAGSAVSARKARSAGRNPP